MPGKANATKTKGAYKAGSAGKHVFIAGRPVDRSRGGAHYVANRSAAKARREQLSRRKN